MGRSAVDYSSGAPNGPSRPADLTAKRRPTPAVRSALTPLDSEVLKRRGKREPQRPITARRECKTELLPAPQVYLAVINRNIASVPPVIGLFGKTHQSDLIFVWAKKIILLGSTPIKLKLCEPQGLCIIRAHTKFQLPTCKWARESQGENRGISVQNPFWATNSGYFLTSARHMTCCRVVEAYRTLQDHTLDDLSTSMALRYDGSNVGVVLLLHCFHAVSFPSHDRNRLNSN